MKKTIKIDVEKPFEEGLTYTTKMQTAEKFTISRIERTSKGEMRMFYGVYERSPHLGDCPMYPDRLIPKYEKKDVEIDVCDSCGREF